MGTASELRLVTEDKPEKTVATAATATWSGTAPDESGVRSRPRPPALRHRYELPDLTSEVVELNERTSLPPPVPPEARRRPLLARSDERVDFERVLHSVRPLPMLGPAVETADLPSIVPGASAMAFRAPQLPKEPNALEIDIEIAIDRKKAVRIALWAALAAGVLIVAFGL